MRRLIKVVGIARQILTPATAYVSPFTFAKAVGRTGESDTLRIAVNGSDPDTVRTVIREIERVFEKENINVKAIISEKLPSDAQSGHVYIFIFALLFMSGLMAVVGVLGLMSAMGTSVTERTREFGIMRAIGGRSGSVIGSIIFEGVFIGLLSWIIAVFLSLPLSSAVGRFVGNLAFRSPLPLSISAMAAFTWLLFVVLRAVAASAYPARKASRLTIRETLAYE